VDYDLIVIYLLSFYRTSHNGSGLYSLGLQSFSFVLCLVRVSKEDMRGCRVVLSK